MCFKYHARSPAQKQDINSYRYMQEKIDSSEFFSKHSHTQFNTCIRSVLMEFKYVNNVILRTRFHIGTADTIFISTHLYRRVRRHLRNQTDCIEVKVSGNMFIFSGGQCWNDVQVLNQDKLLFSVSSNCNSFSRY